MFKQCISVSSVEKEGQEPGLDPNAGLTAARINLIFGMHTHIWSDCTIGYMVLTIEVIKGHFRSNKFLCKVPSGVLLAY